MTALANLFDIHLNSQDWRRREIFKFEAEHIESLLDMGVKWREPLAENILGE